MDAVRGADLTQRHNAGLICNMRFHNTTLPLTTSTLPLGGTITTPVAGCLLLRGDLRPMYYIKHDIIWAFIHNTKRRFLTKCGDHVSIPTSAIYFTVR